MGYFQSADGSSYSGQFFDDVMEGEGTYRFADGRVYTGSWRNSQALVLEAKEDTPRVEMKPRKYVSHNKIKLLMRKGHQSMLMLKRATMAKMEVTTYGIRTSTTFTRTLLAHEISTPTIIYRSTPKLNQY